MSRRLLLALIILVAAPLALLGWLSASTYRQQQRIAHEQLIGFFQSRLSELDRSLAGVLDAYARDLSVDLKPSRRSLPETLQGLDRSHPIVRQCMLVDDNGDIVYPPKPGQDAIDDLALYAAMPAIAGSRADLSDPAEEDFESRTGDGGLVKPATQSERDSRIGRSKGMSKSVSRSPNKAAAAGSSGDGHWQVWYMDEGLQLIYWLPRDEGGAVGVLLERARWISDLTAALPDSTPSYLVGATDGEGTPASGFTALADESKRIVYRWGSDDAYSGGPLATRALSWPLTSWQLEYHSDDPLPGSVATPVLVSLAGIGVVLLALGGYVLTGVQRQMRAARNRVSFASQVSHELRTPLTNIRLYAELAESDLKELPMDSSRRSIEKRLRVIDTESRRLGRLVSGVLEMIRDDRKQQSLRIASVVPDEVINDTVIQFAPSFGKAGLTVQRDLNAPHRVGLDADVLEMILVNLLSNVEKYASEGEFVRISSRLVADRLVVRLADEGPGIARRHQESVFRAFHRLDDSIRAPSGTGIGLTIARKLARRHGGELELLKSDRGACFELRLKVEVCHGRDAIPDSGE